MENQRFGMLWVVSQAPASAAGKPRWLCRCDCGAFKEVQAGNLKSGHTTTCGGHRPKSQLKHGMYGTPVYRAWSAMLSRCRNPNRDNWDYYGGRGIKVCDRWLEFEAFYADMGEPNGLSIDRIDVNGDYEPGNCRWVTWKEQCQNRRPRGPNKTSRKRMAAQTVPNEAVGVS